MYIMWANVCIGDEMANSVYIRIPTWKKNTFYGSCTELGTLVFIRLRETAEKRERKSGLSEADRWPSSTLYKLLLHIILGYLVDDGRRPRRRGVGVVRPRFDRDQRRRIIFYPTGLIDGRLLCVRSFSPLFLTLIGFFHPSTSSSTLHAKYTEYIIISHMCRTHKSPCE
jgi:hypothetical protein